MTHSSGSQAGYPIFIALLNATAPGPTRVSSPDVEFAMHQLVEVAVRALSPGTNDPHMAIRVVDRLGAPPCDLAPLYLPTGLQLCNGQVPSVEYDGLVDTMFNMTRPNASRSPALLIKLIEVVTAVANYDRAPRLQTLLRHADLVRADAELGFSSKGT